VIYLATPSTPAVRDAMASGRLGAMLTAGSWRNLNDEASGRFPWIGLDNECFSTKAWDEQRWVDWLHDMLPRLPEVLFAVVPDVVGDHEATLERWYRYAPMVQHLGYPAAFVLQDGVTSEEIPWDSGIGAIFTGGSTEFKLSQTAWDIAQEARDRNVWTHLGRCNSFVRLRAAASGDLHGRGTYDSADGTYLAFGPDRNLPKLLSWLDWIDHNQPLMANTAGKVPA